MMMMMMMMIILISDNLAKIITKWLKMCVQYPTNNVQTASGSGNDEAGNVGAAASFCYRENSLRIPKNGNIKQMSKLR
jgi:hypothetical protein